MKDPNGFDELARQKLAQRGFAFDPSHWADMERSLRDGDRKPKAWWPWMAAGLLLLGGGAVWFNLADKAEITSNATVTERIEPTRETTPVIVDPVIAPEQAMLPAQEQAQQPSPNERSSSVTTVPKGTAVSSTSKDKPRAPSAEKKHVPHEVGQPITPRAAHPEKPIHVSDVTPADIVPVSTTTTAVDLPASGAAQVSTSMGEPSGTHGEESLTHAAPGSTSIRDMDTGHTVPPSEDPLQVVVPPSVADAPPVTSEGGLSTVSGPIPDPAVATVPVVATVPPSTAGEAAAQTPPATWLVVRSPYELSVLGGAFSSIGTYSGNETERWGATTQRQNTLGFGAELMRNLGDHFGVGVGAHYARYRERLVADETSRNDQWINSSYILVPHDTMVLVVTDTVTIGATDYYVTELQPLTINTVEHVLDTSYTTTVTRERRTVVNTISYLELPLFFDAHTSAGRWLFGLRGGPTFGFLTGRKGALPIGDEVGYTDLRDRAFSSVTWGCSARAYVRYRLSRSLAVGLEPAWRQQFGNAFGDPGLQRRGSALGGYLSLSYRFGGNGIAP